MHRNADRSAGPERERRNAKPDLEAPADTNGDDVYEFTVAAFDGSLSDTQARSVTAVLTVLGESEGEPCAQGLPSHFQQKTTG